MGTLCQVVEDPLVAGTVASAGLRRNHGHLLLTSQGTYAGLPDFLTQVVESELARIPRAFARSHPDLRWTIVYLPQVCLPLCMRFLAFCCMREEALWLAV